MHFQRLTDLRLNLVSSLQVGAGLASTLAVMALLGTGPEADAYAFAQLLTLVAGYAALLPVEQVLPAHVRRAEADAAEAEAQTAGLLGAALIWGPVLGVIFLGLGILLSLKVLPAVPAVEACKILALLAPGLALVPVLHVLRCRLQIAGSYGGAQAAATLPSVGLLIMAGTLAAGIPAGAWLLAGGTLLGTVAQGLTLAFRLARDHPRCRPRLPGRELLPVIGEGIRMRLAHTLHGIGTQGIAMAALTVLPPGTLAVYGYARRAIEAALLVTSGPALAILATGTAAGIASGDRDGLDSLRRRYLIRAVPLALAAMIAGGLLLPLLLPHLGREGQLTAHAPLLTALYLAGMGWQIIILVEAPAVSVLVALGRAWRILSINFLFVAVFSAVHVLTIPAWGALGVPLAGCLAQLLSATLFTLAAQPCLPPRSFRS